MKKTLGSLEAHKPSLRVSGQSTYIGQYHKSTPGPGHSPGRETAPLDLSQDWWGWWEVISISKFSKGLGVVKGG